MSSSSTSKLGLFKAVPGTGEPFRTSDLNDNWDAVDAECVSVDARFDVVEANSWVTSARIADGAVGVSELANTLDLSGKTVSVAVPSADGHASTKKYVDDTVAAGVGGAWVSYTPTVAGGSNVSASAVYSRVGKTVFVRVEVGFAGQPTSPVTVSLPVEAVSSSLVLSGYVKSTYALFGTVSTTGGVSKVALKVLNTGSNPYGTMSNVTTSVPAAFVDSDEAVFTAVYEAV